MFELFDHRRGNYRIEADYFRLQVARKGIEPIQVQLRLVLWRDSIDVLQWNHKSRVRWYLDRAENALAMELDVAGLGSKLSVQSGNHRRVEVVIPTAVAALVTTWADFEKCNKYRAICTADPTTGRLEVRLGEPIGPYSHGEETKTTNHEHTYIVEPFEGGA